MMLSGQQYTYMFSFRQMSLTFETNQLIVE